MSTVLNVKNVSKTFKDKVVLRQATFEVKSGEIFGLVGPANSGKSTLMKIVCGLVSASSGSVEINGQDISDNYEEAMIYLGGNPEKSNIYTNMTGLQNLNYYAGLYPNIENKKQRIDSIAEFMGLEDCMKSLAKTYSKDKLKKLCIAQALLHFPKIIVLDDITKDLSKDDIEKMRKFLIKLIKTYNIGVLVSSDNLKEMELLCDKIAVMSGGEILDIKSASEIQAGIKLGEKTCFEVNYPNYGAKILKENMSLKPYAIGSEILVKIADSETKKIATFLEKNGVAIFGIRTITVTFEDIYNSILRKNYKGFTKS